RMNGHVIKEGTYYSLTINSKDAIRFQEVIGFACPEKSGKLAVLVSRQQQGIDAMRSKFIMPFDWRERFEHLFKATRTYAYYRPELQALSAAQLRTIAADPMAKADDLRAIEDILDSQLLVSKIKTIRLHDSPEQVYDFEVADHHNYIVDGI